MSFNLNIKPFWAFLFSIVVVIIFRAFGYVGHFGYDDMQYAALATNLLNGDIDFDNHFTYRLTILATALSYKVFGINDFSSSLPSVLLTIITLFVIYLILKNKGFIITTFGLLLTISIHWLLSYSVLLMPDIYVVTFTTIAMFAYYQHKYQSHKNTALFAILFVVSLLLDFMSKGSVVLLVPWLLYLFVIDIVSHQNKKFWIWSSIIGFVCLLVYFVSIKLLTGEFLYRFKAIEQNGYLNLCSYSEQPIGILLKRLFVDFFKMTINESLAVPIIFIVVAFINSKWKIMLKIKSPSDFFIVSAAILFLSSNFMTISLSSYNPMCIDPRHYLFFIPIASIGASYLISEKLSQKQIIAILVLLTIIVAYTFFRSRNNCLHVYLPLYVAFVLAIIIWKSTRNNRFASAILLISLFIDPIITIKNNNQYGYVERRNILMDSVINNSKIQTIISDEVQTRMLRYYADFSNNGRYQSFDEFNPANSYSKKLLILNYHTIALSGMSKSDFPFYANYVIDTQKPKYDSLGIKIYEADLLKNIIQQTDTLCFSINNFDSAVPKYWNKNQQLSEKTRYRGKRSNKVGKYSATFKYPLDSLICAGYDTVMVQVSAFCNCYSNTNCLAVISLENQTNNFLWSSSTITNNLRAYSHWYKFDFEKEIHLKELPSDAMLMVYFYKTDYSKLFIDDFGVTICTKKIKIVDAE